MQWEVDWLDDSQELIVGRVEGDFDAATVLGLARRIYEMIDSVSHRVNVICDFSQAGAMLGNPLSPLAEVASLHHPRTGQLMIVTCHTLGRMMVSIYSRVFNRITAFDSLEEALDSIRSAD